MVMSFWAPTGNRFPFFVPLYGYFSDDHRIAYKTSYPDTAVLFENLQPPIKTNVSELSKTCVSGYDDQGNYFNDVQFPVTSGPFAGIVDTCEQMPVFCGEAPIAPLNGYCLGCRRVHLTLGSKGGPGSIVAHIHCPHAGLKQYDPNGDLYPCWNS